MSLKEDLLNYIVEASKPNINPQNPHGYCYIEAGHEATATELHNEELIQALVTSRAQDGSFPVRPTDMAIKWATAGRVTHDASGAPVGQAAPQATPLAPGQLTTQQAGPQHPQPSAPVNLQIETGVPIPDKKAFGRATSGDDKVTQFGFANMPINASFFIPQPQGDDKPIHRTFSSTVSQANKKLHPMNFVIREWTQPDGTKGARVWRVEDMQGERPTRTRKKAEPAPAPQAGGQPQFMGGPQPGAPFGAVPQPGPSFPGGFAAPGNPAFGGGAPAPAPFGGQPSFGGAPAPAAPQGWGGAPQFDGQPLPDFNG